MTEIELGDLDMASTHKIVQDLLGHDDEDNDDNNNHSRTFQLSQLCHQKTHGNVFFLLQFLDMLHQQQLLQFNFGTLAWTWDNAEIEASTQVSDNVVDLLQNKMKTNLLASAASGGDATSSEAAASSSDPHYLLQLLQIASYLGSSFQIKMLRLVWENFHVDNDNSNDNDNDNDNHGNGNDNDNDDNENTNSLQLLLEEGLKVLHDEGYIILRNDQKYLTDDLTICHWTHDKIQEAAASLIPERDKNAFGKRVGTILATTLKGDSLAFDSAIFVIANLLNAKVEVKVKEGNKEDNKEEQGQGQGQERNPAIDNMASEDNNILPIDIAQLNLDASRKAMSLSAFESAAEYAARGIELLMSDNDTTWSEHYQLALDLYKFGAQAENASGNVEVTERYCQQVVSFDSVPLNDKLALYNIWADGILNSGQPQQAVNLIMDVLRKYKCRFPKSKPAVTLGIVSNILRIKATMKSRDFVHIPEMEDATRMELMKLLDRLFTSCYINKDARMPLVVFRSLNWSLKYGICEYTPVALATTGMILTGVLGDIQGGALYGRHALGLIERTKSVTADARTMFCVYSFLLSWVEPAKNLLKPLLRAYTISGYSPGKFHSMKAIKAKQGKERNLNIRSLFMSLNCWQM